VSEPQQISIATNGSRGTTEFIVVICKMNNRFLLLTATFVKEL